jgi:hypothetical protein
MSRQWYLESLDPDGKRTVTNVYKEVYRRSSQYYDLVVTRKDEDKYDFEHVLDAYELFDWIKRLLHSTRLCKCPQSGQLGCIDSGTP